ncbi:MAG TPA: cytochrome P460 family protein [Terriglobales bacterium]|nr:cytochrome P460 family protein [Terriglobales bacterium]
MDDMRSGWFIGLALLVPALLGAGAHNQPLNKVDGPQYTADGRMLFPANYREWIYLSSGLGMSYTAGAQKVLMFDNVFVSPGAYQKFLETGSWPDKTVLVLEVRGAGSKASINKAGHFQTGDSMGVEVHVKDEGHFAGKWAFFGFEDGTSPAKQVPVQASCYSCHTEHGAVDTTFVQFYPTLIGIAKEKKTLSAGYLKESAAK